MKQRLLYIWLILLLFITGFPVTKAQTGAWTPAGADYSYPRTLLKASDLTRIQQTLTSPDVYTLYSGVYSNGASASVPSDNTNSSGRRSRAKMAKNAAFVLYLDRQPAGSNAVSALTATQRAQLETKLITLLENINTAVEPYYSFSGGNYNEWQWRSKELIDYLIAYDLMRGAGISETSLSVSKARLQQFSGNLYSASITPFFGTIFYNTIKNNHTLMTASALGMAAVVLNDASSTTAALQPQNWISLGLYHIDNVLWQDAQKQSIPGVIAGYAEGPYYFKYAFLNCLPFIRAIGNFLPDTYISCTWSTTTRSIRNPWYDPNYDNLYSWAATITMPDGRLPALEDSYIDMGMPELALTGKAQYVKPMAFSKFETGQLNSLNKQLADLTVDMRAAYIAAGVSAANPSVEPSLTVLPESGNLIFRSGEQSTATYLHVYGKNGSMLSNSGGHNHADAGSFILQAYGQLLALDPGYLSYDRRGEVGNAYNHNMILVDGAGPAIGTSGNANDATAYIQNSFFTPELAYGEVSTTYNGATILRKTLSVRNEYYLMTDAVSAAQAHQYTWQLHGYGLEGGTTSHGTFTDNLTNGQATWQKNGVSLLAHVTTTNGASSYQKSTGIHEITYNTTQDHTVMKVNKNTVANTEFLSVLYPYESSAPIVNTLSTTGAAAIELQDGNYTDIVFAQSGTALLSVLPTALPSAVSSDALFTFYSVTNTNEAKQIFLQDGTVLNYGTEELLRSSNRANIAWQQTDSETAEGYVNQATTLTLPAPNAPAQVNGSNILNWMHDATLQELTITFSGASDYTIQNIIYNPLPVELISFTARRLGSNVILDWATASETNNQGFEIQRSTNAVDFKAIGFVNGKGNPYTRSDYKYEDLTAPFSEVYYRIKQTDLDGSSSYFKVVFVKASSFPETALQVWPIPAQNELQVRDSHQTFNFLQLFTTDGKLLLEKVYQEKASLNMSHVKPGLYLLRFTSDDPEMAPVVQKVIVAR